MWLVFFLFSPQTGATQTKNLGLPQIQSYEKQDYKSGTENWGINFQGSKTLFANQAGLLVYDGSNWKTYVTPLNTILRSVNVVNDTIWIGGQSELGYFIPNDSGSLVYHSITDAFAAQNFNLGEIWDLEYINGVLYLRSDTHTIYSYQKGTVSIVQNAEWINKLTKVNDKLLINDKNDGISSLDSNDNQLTHEFTNELNLTIIEFLNDGDNTYVFTEKNGVYIYRDRQLKPWKTNVDNYLKDKIVRCAIYNDKLGFMIGTKLGGFVHLNPNGKALHVITKRNGLLSNEINKIAIGSDMTIWLASNTGIDQFNFDTGHNVFYPDGELQGAIYDIKKWKGKLVFCTSNGVYSIDDKEYYNPLQDIKFNLIEGTVGQSWGLDIIDDELFLAHESGAFRINKEFEIEPILLETGTWKFVKIDENLIAVGTYSGVYLIENNNESWKKISYLSGIDESCRVMIHDKHDNLWISHPYKKVYKITFSEDYKSSSIKEYDSTNGLNTNSRNYVHSIEDECIVTNETGVYKFDEEADTFVKYKALDSFFQPNIHLKRIFKNSKNRYWTIASNGTKLYEKSKNQGFKQIKKLDNTIDLSNYIGGFENLYSIDSLSLFLSTIKGVNNVSTSQFITEVTPPNITNISLPSKRDSAVFGGFGEVPILELAKDERAVKFEFNSGVESPNHQNLYSHELEGVDNWSYPSPTQSKEYNNLKSGNYTFRVMSITPNGKYSKPSVIQFTIATPWYQSLLAKALYALLAVIVLLGLLLIPRQRYQKTNAILETEKKNTEDEMEALRIKSERELEAIKREQLETEILFKNKELAMSTMHLLQKNQTLTAIRTEVEKNLSKIKDPNAKKEVKKIISLLRSDDRLEDDWSNFSLHFDQAHHNFLKRMKSTYPQLTPKDQKLCAYLRMNLTTKEIAPLLNISVRGVEISRYRLRKKIELEKDKNLNDFMMDF